MAIRTLRRPLSHFLLRDLPFVLLSGLLSGCSGMSPRLQPSFSGEWLVNGKPQISAASPGHVPHQARTPQSQNLNPQLALVLGGGGMRGFAHIGVLQAFEEAGIRPDLVVGTSIGAIIGAAYAAGTSPDQLWQLANTMQVHSLADVTFSGPGLVKGEALALWARGLVGGQTIEHFPLRFAAVATDLDRAQPYVITHGDAGQALRASAAIPGVFLPVQTDGLTLVDGGVSALVPVYAARALGADVVIAVDIYCHGPQYAQSSAISMVLRVWQMQSCLLSGPEAASADVLIAPAVAPAGTDDIQGRETARRQGYEAAMAQLAALRALLQRHGPVTLVSPAVAP